MEKGKVKWLKCEKGLGLMEVEGEEDVLVDLCGIEGEGLKSLEEGEGVCFEMVEGKGGGEGGKVSKEG